MALTPMMEQYNSIKEQYPDAILFFRLGDFYEMFFDDAKIASRELELVLTGKDCGLAERAPMCGIPFHSADNYIAKLVSKGYKVAICEQTEDPQFAKGLVSRDVIRVVTAGTVIESSMLDETKNNYLACVFSSGSAFGLCFTDVSTGKLYCCELAGKNAIEKTKNELAKYMPTEILVNKTACENIRLRDFLNNRTDITAELADDADFDFEFCKSIILSHFNCESLETLNLTDKPEAVTAVGCSLNYLMSVQKNDLANITSIEIFNDTKYMSVDADTRRNLELTESMRRKEKKGSLLWVLDYTKTAMGKRMIRTWIEQPLVGIAEIHTRLNSVEELIENPILLSDEMNILADINDFERIITRVVYSTANAKELRSLAQTFEKLPELKNQLKSCRSRLLAEIYDSTDTLQDAVELINSAIADDPPLTVREGGMIRSGYNRELDELNDIVAGGKGFLSKIEEDEQQKTGIKKLKIGYNRVFGYYIEVTNSFRDLVPDTYIRKQTLANCERYITQELKELESRVLGAQERIVRLEYELFCDVRSKIAEMQYRAKRTAQAVAVLDVLCSFAFAAVQNSYERPQVDASDVIEIREGRHPVVEKFLTSAPFVPNDSMLDCRDNRLSIITGPNMAGKSTYMRQTALIVIMAQVGSFVPAKSARIGIVDGIYTRIGASDDLSAGQSTFMTEMTEVASILKNATANSLILLDEIGRGTSTYDGMSIAKAVIEYACDTKKLGAKTLFATHYHELTELEKEMPGVKNYNIAVKKRGDEITFLRKIVRGGADGSYGVEVAKLAGVPQSIVKRAKVILSELEAGERKISIGASDNGAMETEQISFEGNISSEIIEEIKAMDVNTLTPIEALTKLYELKSRLME